MDQGVYSDISDQDTSGKKFLRGYQITDNNGTVRFTTREEPFIYTTRFACLVVQRKL